MRKLVVRYTEGVPGVSYSNIRWKGAFPCRHGYFPANHPCAASSSWSGPPDYQHGSGTALDAFRSIGYWASCFPEGEGMSLKPPDGKTRADVVRDIETTFGWKVAKKGATP